MINLETLYEISVRHTKSMGTLITDETKRINMGCCHIWGHARTIYRRLLSIETRIWTAYIF